MVTSIILVVFGLFAIGVFILLIHIWADSFDEAKHYKKWKQEQGKEKTGG